MDKVYLIVSIDTECDKGPGWEIQKPMSFTNIYDGIPKVLTPLFDRYKIKPTYLLSPEIIDDSSSVQVLQELENKELGTHLHGEFVEPQSKMDTGRTKIPQLYYSESVEQHKLKNLTDIFFRAFGYSPTSFRAGRWGMSNHTLSILENLGYKVDSSVCPFTVQDFKELGRVNFWGAPVIPYRPSEIDFRKKGNMRIVEMPMTIGNKDLFRIPRRLFRTRNEKPRKILRAVQKMGLNTRITTFRPYRSSVAEMQMLASDMVSTYGKSGPVFLNMMFHSNEIVAAASPYPQTAKEVDKYINDMDQLFESLSCHYNLNPIGLSDVAITSNLE